MLKSNLIASSMQYKVKIICQFFRKVFQVSKNARFHNYSPKFEASIFHEPLKLCGWHFQGKLSSSISFDIQNHFGQTCTFWAMIHSIWPKNAKNASIWVTAIYKIFKTRPQNLLIFSGMIALTYIFQHIIPVCPGKIKKFYKKFKNH